MKIKKILIANRGEIVMRVIKTCKKLGIKTVTVYSDDDSSLPHSYSGDENFHLAGEGLAETYLNIQKIIEIAKETGADAIHPGYGFLSENQEFAKALEKNGIIFIGPNVHAIELMGDKKSSKVEMERIGVPLIPGYHGEDQDSQKLLVEAKKIGFPVLVKAVAGGGGKGMKIVSSESEFLEALESAKREAKNAFGDDKVLLEKYLENPRHIEVQIVSDGAGNHFHFFERECSIQRRYQKIIEETPSLALDEELRLHMCRTAVSIAQHIQYTGAGTVELILDKNKKFYFLEMNTRLQVEHPITEMLTDTDLVELQIRAAQGEAFPFTQDDITASGHALECRVYAENPDQEFLPTTGTIQYVGHSDEARLDSGFAVGNEVGTKYDPMLAKVITWGRSRQEAINKMCRALDEIKFAGVMTNRQYMKRVLKHKAFGLGDYHTHFLKDYSDDLKPAKLSDRENGAFIAALLGPQDKSDTWDRLVNFRNL